MLDILLSSSHRLAISRLQTMARPMPTYIFRGTPEQGKEQASRLVANAGADINTIGARIDAAIFVHYLANLFGIMERPPGLPGFGKAVAWWSKTYNHFDLHAALNATLVRDVQRFERQFTVAAKVSLGILTGLQPCFKIPSSRSYTNVSFLTLVSCHRCFTLFATVREEILCSLPDLAFQRNIMGCRLRSNKLWESRRLNTPLGVRL